MSWLWPNGTTTRPTINSPFGPRTPFKTANGNWASSNHKGVDLVGFSTVRSVTDGKVTHVGTPPGWSGGGYQVWVKNTDGSVARYFHLVRGSARVKVGDRVNAGGALGRMGETGNAAGVHLHLEIVPKGAWAQVDPIPYIQDRINSAAGGGGTPFEEDDMSAEAEAKIDALYAGFYGARNLTGKADPISWVNKDGDVQKANYGLLPIDIHTQTLVAQLIGQVAALTKLVQQLGTGGGTIDMAAIEQAAEKGARDALSGLTLKAVTDE